MKNYRIRSLKWVGKIVSDTNDNFVMSTDTVFGSMWIFKQENEFKWSYCFDEYYDEDYGTFGTL